MSGPSQCLGYHGTTGHLSLDQCLYTVWPGNVDALLVTGTLRVSAGEVADPIDTVEEIPCLAN